MLKTQPKHRLGYLLLDFAFTVLTRGMAHVGKSFESKISKPTKLDCKQIFL